ncbi:hypothetical protein WT67_15045 [Burkholderia stagnalis]|nr:hypothetical protein WT17_22730 [Burkholderia stagnalis]KVO73056.1 hypothetical protein WT19_15945 [Burkholderia stagnalis]KVW61407.1 hypothetical protein WT28_17765 [Burkholderia stagnalis]KVW76375.1 hypothetical protein WT29_21135 [Burkholderia stagnalis]KVX67124.1 hypothetical protein WT34_26695 [Burkholderia stagnalis]
MYDDPHPLARAITEFGIVWHLYIEHKLDDVAAYESTTLLLIRNLKRFGPSAVTSNATSQAPTIYIKFSKMDFLTFLLFLLNCDRFLINCEDRSFAKVRRTIHRRFENRS